MGEDFLKRLRTNKKIDALPEIIIGKMPIGGVGNKEKKTTSGASQSGGDTSKSDESGDHRAIGTWKFLGLRHVRAFGSSYEDEGSVGREQSGDIPRQKNQSMAVKIRVCIGKNTNNLKPNFQIFHVISFWVIVI